MARSEFNSSEKSMLGASLALLFGAIMNADRLGCSEFVSVAGVGRGEPANWTKMTRADH